METSAVELNKKLGARVIALFILPLICALNGQLNPSDFIISNRALFVNAIINAHFAAFCFSRLLIIFDAPEKSGEEK